MYLENLLFYFFSSVSIFCGLMVIGSKNPIHSILSLILVFCNVAGLLILLEVEFLAMMFLVVYVGAIAILFLFVVMMLNIKLVELQENLVRYLPIGALIGFIFLVEVFLVLDQNLVPAPDLRNTAILINWSSEIENITNIEALGSVLYTHYFYLFLIASMILLVAMIGAIILTLHHRNDVKRQDIYRQVARDLEDPITLKY
jgi:NADH-quinone oxidoreductase subunit J